MSSETRKKDFLPDGHPDRDTTPYLHTPIGRAITAALFDRHCDSDGTIICECGDGGICACGADGTQCTGCYECT